MKIIKPFLLFLLVLIIIPVDGLFGDYRYETCTDKDDAFSNSGDETWNSFPISSYREYYHICKIGYVEGYVSIGWGINAPQGLTFSVSVLNNENMNKFTNGQAYGHSNADLAELALDMDIVPSDGSGSTRILKYTDAELIGDNYYLVINLQYRNDYVPDEVTEKSRTERFSLWYGDVTTENSDLFTRFFYSVDVDYKEGEQESQ
tara:strand:+ start:312 stop:923 length:612 start_codon:yes stop_codon:yes gene_type:complete